MALCLGGSLALAGEIVDLDAWLDIVGIDIETDPGTIVLDRVALHLDAAGHQLVAMEIRGDPVQDMVAGLLYIVSYHILKGQHALHVEKAGTGDQIALIGILTGELVADQMAAVI